jgi:uncharacterized membrane protein YkoI
MSHARTLLVFLLFAAGAAHATPAADERRVCLGPEQRRAAIADRQALPLIKAVRIVRNRLKGEIVNARLCAHGNGLVYVLTVLARDGKVTRVSLDGESGAILRER